MASGSSLNVELARAQLEETEVSLEAARDDLKAGRYARAVFNTSYHARRRFLYGLTYGRL